MTATKSDEYYGLDRSDLYSFAHRVGMRIDGRALNVGCAGGRDAPFLRSLGATELHGVEPMREPAAAASLLYDEVAACSIDEWDWDGRLYDLVVFADVLEHLARPDAVLSTARDWLSAGGRLLISVPNVRHISVLWSLAVRGEWRYEQDGILDDTHLRFFTSRSFRRLLYETGYDCLAFERYGLHPLSRAMSRIVPRAGEFFLSQVFAVARPAWSK